MQFPYQTPVEMPENLKDMTTPLVEAIPLTLKDVLTQDGAPTDTFKPMDTIRSIQHWFEKTRPEKTARDYLSQLACHFEEVAECVDAIGQDYHAILRLRDRVRETRAACADSDCKGNPLPEDWRKELLDSLCDQIVTAIGVAHCANLDIVGALAEVNYSNWSKFENGEPVRDKYGKITKGRNYKTPVLDQYVLETPKWAITKLQVGALFKVRNAIGDTVVEVLSIVPLRSNSATNLITYRFVKSGETYAEYEREFREGFEHYDPTDQEQA